MKKGARILLAAALLGAGAFVLHAVNKDQRTSKRGKKAKKQQAIPYNPYQGMDMRQLTDMSLKDFRVFASNKKNMQDVQESVRQTVYVMNTALREAHYPVDYIELLDDLPEVDEIIKKAGWLELDPKIQKKHMDQTDTNLKEKHLKWLKGKLPPAAYSQYKTLLQNNRVPYQIIPLR